MGVRHDFTHVQLAILERFGHRCASCGREDLPLPQRGRRLNLFLRSGARDLLGGSRAVTGRPLTGVRLPHDRQPGAAQGPRVDSAGGAVHARHPHPRASRRPGTGPGADGTSSASASSPGTPARSARPGGVGGSGVSRRYRNCTRPSRSLGHSWSPSSTMITNFPAQCGREHAPSIRSIERRLPSGIWMTPSYT